MISARELLPLGLIDLPQISLHFVKCLLPQELDDPGVQRLFLTVVILQQLTIS